MELKLFDFERYFSEKEYDDIFTEIEEAHSILHSRSGKGAEFTGWLDLPVDYDKEEFARIKTFAEKVRRDSEVLVVIGIGGSYLGAQAAIDYIRSDNYNLIKKDGPEIYFAGNGISAGALSELLTICKDKDISLNVISKSGTTLEPALAFRVFREYLENKYGNEEAAKRIYCTTDKENGALKKLCREKGYETFIIPDDVGGRFSVLTPVGLFPIAVSGADIDKIMQGAAEAREKYSVFGKENDCYRYVAARNLLLRKGKTTEILVSYEKRFSYMSEWWKQLYGESEGKENKGIYPSSVVFSRDLHSLGQYIQSGIRNIFETTVYIKDTGADIKINKGDNIDGLDFLAGKGYSYINEQAFMGTLLAHNDGGVPNIIIYQDDWSEKSFGELVYFFEKACAVSGYVLGVNPFDQPGVEAYKKNMFALLGKPGYEEQKKIIQDRLKNI